MPIMILENVTQVIKHSILYLLPQKRGREERCLHEEGCLFQILTRRRIAYPKCSWNVDHFGPRIGHVTVVCLVTWP